MNKNIRTAKNSKTVKKSKTVKNVTVKNKTKKLQKYKFNKKVNYSNIDNICNDLTAFIDKYGDSSYPIKKYISGKYSANLRAIKYRFNNLREYKYKLINKPFTFRANYDLPHKFMKYRDIETNMTKPTVILFDKENYFQYDLISDYFQELVRMKCKRYDTPSSPYNYWLGIKNNKYDKNYHHNNIKSILKLCIKKFSGNVNAFTLSETLNKLTNECTSFRPTVIVSLIKLFGDRKRILDISSGWGDRLIGAIASNVDYYFGVDPNPAVHSGYNEIRRVFGVSDKKFVIKQEGFEKVKIQMPPGKDKDGKQLKFDLIMTSPPYFDLEVYTDAQGQSVLGRGKNAWLNEFMLPSLKKAWNVLGPGGVLALNISNKIDTNKGNGYVEDIIKYMNSMNDSDFRGCIAYGDFRHGTTQLRNPQPVWIWLKQ